MRKKLITAAATLVTLAPLPVLAQVTIVPACATVKGIFGKPPPVPQLTCMLEMFGNIALLILGVTGSIALLMFVYGGFMIVISGGESGRVTKGKTIIRNAVIGILIIMVSGVVLQYAVKQLGINNKKFQIIGQPCTEIAGGVYVQMPDGKVECKAPEKIK